MTEKEDKWDYFSLCNSDDHCKELQSRRFDTGVEEADEWGSYSVDGYSPIKGHPLYRKVLAFGTLSFIGEGGLGSDCQWIMTKDGAIEYETDLFASEDLVVNAQVEEAFDRNIRLIIPKPRKRKNKGG